MNGDLVGLVVAVSDADGLAVCVTLGDADNVGVDDSVAVAVNVPHTTVTYPRLHSQSELSELSSCSAYSYHRPSTTIGRTLCAIPSQLPSSLINVLPRTLITQ